MGRSQDFPSQAPPKGGASWAPARGPAFLKMTDIGKILFLIGITITLLGGILILSSKFPFLGRLPGDIHIKREGFEFFFPITTLIFLSVFLSIIINIISKFKK